MTAPTFVERLPHEAGFARVFGDVIAPELERVERDRRRSFRQVAARLGIAAGGLAALVAIILILPLSFETSARLVPVLVVVGLVVGAIWASGPYKRYKSGLRRLLVGPVCDFLGELEYTRKPGWGDRVRRFRELGVIPGYRRAEIEDRFEGRHRDTGFRLVEAKLIRSSGRSQRTVFDGLLFEIEVPVPFACEVLIRPSRGRLGDALAEVLARWFPGRLRGKTRMAFEDPRFARSFVVHADDPAEARRLMTPGFRATLLEFAADYGPGWRRFLPWPFRPARLAAAFAEGTFFLAVPAPGNHFEVGALWRSAYACEHDIRRFMRDIVRARQIIDYLHGDRPRA